MSNKYNKFIVGAASAALVATAVAPMASAKDFSDTKGNTHQPAIDALSNAGVISGYPDGSFKPNKTLTRSDVVKLMGKWLVAKGYKIPTDYKTNMRFTDLTAKSNDELLQSAAIVKEYGVFNGSNGRLLAGDNITRENMAVVIVRAFDTVEDLNLVSFVAAQDFKKDVTDLSSAKAEARTAIDVLDYFDITNPATPKFNPKNTTTRGQFATFLQKSIDTDFSVAKEDVVSEDQKAVDAAALLVKAGNVTVSKGEQATAEAKLAAVAAYVDSLVADKEIKSTVVAGTKAGEYNVTLTKGEAKAVKTMDVTFGYAADDRFVANVKSINATQLEVKFSTEVDASSLFNSDGTLKANTVSLTSLDSMGTVTLKGMLSADSKTLTVTTSAPVSKRYDIKIENLKSKDGKAFDKYSEMITIAADTTAPTILGAERISASQVKVKFSEPMKAFTGTTFKYADGTAIAKSATGVDGNIATGADEVIFTLGSDVTANKEIVATFIGAQDQAGNLITPNPATVTFTKGGADGTAPVVNTITQTGAKTFAVKFSEQLNANPTVTVGGVTTTVVKDATDPTVYNVTATDVLDNAKTVVVSNFTDLSGEKGTDMSRVVTFVKDSAAPKVVSNNVVKDAATGKEFLEFTFDKNVNIDATPTNTTVSGTGTYVKDFVTSGTTTFAAKQISYKDVANKKVVRVELASFLAPNDFKGSSYTLDLTFAGLTSDTTTAVDTAKVTFVRGEDSVNPSTAVVSVTGFAQDADDNSKINVTFDKAVDGASATNPANYSIDGAVVESVTLNPASSTTQVAVLKLKANSTTFTGTRNISINNVKALGSTELMTPYFTNEVSLKGNVAPTVTSSVLVGTNKIKFTFSEGVTAAGGTGDFTLLSGGATVANAVTTPATTNSNVIEFTLANDVTAAQISQGLTLSAISNTINIKDADGNKLSVPASIVITQ